MVFVGVGLFVVAAACWFFGQQAQKKQEMLMATQAMCCKDLGETLDAVTGELDDSTLGQVVEVNGKAKPGPVALVAPLSNRPCVWYRSEITEHYREYEWVETGTGENKQRRRELKDKSRTVSNETSSDAFVIDDGTGRITVDIDGADIDEPRQVMDRRVQDDDGWGNRFSVKLGPITLQSSAEGTTGYQHEEWVLDVDEQLFAVGKAVKDGNGLRLVKPPKGQAPYIISTRAEEDIRKSAGTNAQVLRIATVVSAVAGVVLVILGLL